MTSKKKPKNKRQKAKYPALDPTLNLKSRYEQIADLDYIDKLSPSEKKWLNKFMEEYVNDKVDRKDLSKNLHNTPALKKDCDDRNNARNRDILTRAKASGQAIYLEDIVETESDKLENHLDDIIDAHNSTRDQGNKSD